MAFPRPSYTTLQSYPGLPPQGPLHPHNISPRKGTYSYAPCHFSPPATSIFLLSDKLTKATITQDRRDEVKPLTAVFVHHHSVHSHNHRRRRRRQRRSESTRSRQRPVLVAEISLHRTFSTKSNAQPARAQFLVASYRISTPQAFPFDRFLTRPRHRPFRLITGTSHSQSIEWFLQSKHTFPPTNISPFPPGRIPYHTGVIEHRSNLSAPTAIPVS